MQRDADAFVDFGADDEFADELAGGATAIDEWRELVAAYLYELPERLDIRLLWAAGQSCFVRVNLWHDGAVGTGRIYRSLFLALDETPDGPRLRDLTTRRAA